MPAPTPYLLAAYCSQNLPPSCSSIPEGWQKHGGAFSSEGASAAPPMGSGPPERNYMAIGGQDVDGPLPTTSAMANWMHGLDYAALDFDMEGMLAGNYAMALDLVSEFRASSSQFSETKFQMTVFGSDQVAVRFMEENHDSIQYVGLMLYGDSMSDDGWSIPKERPETGATFKYIQMWINSSVPNSQIVLGMSGAQLEGYMVDFFKSIVAQYGFAGIMFWNLQEALDVVSKSCLEQADVKCACTAHCVGGSYDGQCCDLQSSTSAGNCGVIGQEACCGDTSGTEGLCQAR